MIQIESFLYGPNNTKSMINTKYLFNSTKEKNHTVILNRMLYDILQRLYISAAHLSIKISYFGSGALPGKMLDHRIIDK